MERDDVGSQRRERKKKRGGIDGSEPKDGKPADVERLLGIAMGCMGMSMDDFCRCAPSEFHAAYEAWRKHGGDIDHGEWERTRMQCLCMLQPYSRQRLRAQDVMQFPWERATEEKDPKKEKSISHEELMERYRKARERAGLL